MNFIIILENCKSASKKKQIRPASPRVSTGMTPAEAWVQHRICQLLRQLDATCPLDGDNCWLDKLVMKCWLKNSKGYQFIQSKQLQNLGNLIFLCVPSFALTWVTADLYWCQWEESSQVVTESWAESSSHPHKLHWNINIQTQKYREQKHCSVNLQNSCWIKLIAAWRGGSET